MKAGNLLFSAVQFVFAVLVILLGGFFIGLEHAPHLRFAIATYFSETAAPFSLIGYLILGCGVLLLVGFYTMNRGTYYRVKMGRKEMQVDPAVIRSYVDVYWKQAFPEHDLSVDVGVSSEQKLELFVELPLQDLEKQKVILEKAEIELGRILHKQIGYKKEFVLSVLIK
ncbi:MAG: hypothetical protein JSS60_09330 [Verrucomicrobia bacterium]|nr:hypothetical protein [Verrucomicrobiota bacterium]